MRKLLPRCIGLFNLVKEVGTPDPDKRVANKLELLDCQEARGAFAPPFMSSFSVPSLTSFPGVPKPQWGSESLCLMIGLCQTDACDIDGMSQTS